MEEEEPSDNLWVLDLDRKKRIKGEAADLILQREHLIDERLGIGPSQLQQLFAPSHAASSSRAWCSRVRSATGSGGGVRCCRPWSSAR